MENESENDLSTCINSHVHAIASTKGYFAEVKTYHHKTGSWSTLHKAVKNSACQMIYGVERDLNVDTPEELFVDALNQNLTLEIKYRKYHVQTQRNAMRAPWMRFLVYHQGSIVMVTEVALFQANVENQNGNDGKRDYAEVSSESERRSVFGRDFQSSSFGESGSESEISGEGENYSLLR